jgi:hypothetical protein
MTNLKIVLGAIVAAAAFALAGPAAAAPDDAVSGAVSVSAHTHSNPGLLFPTDRLAFDFEEGDDFAYSSRTCADSAPFNEVGLDFRPDYPGIDDATGVASVRHLAEGTITEVSQDGDRGKIEGTITSIVCENGEETGDALVMHYTAKFRRTSDNEVQLTGQWRFSPTESTGTFADITGGGSIRAQLTCLGHERNSAMPTCEDLGYFADFVGLRGDTSAPAGETTPGLIGQFRDPTP